MMFSEMIKNSFYKFDKLEIYVNENNVKFLTMENKPVKKVDSMLIDVTVESSNKENFINTLEKADISDSMSHLLQEGLLKELRV